MTLTSFVSLPPVRRRSAKLQPDFELLDEAISLFEDGQQEASIALTLAHLLGKTPPDLRLEPYSMIQGSSRVTLRVEGDELFITVPLVRLTEDGKTTAALRYLLTRVSGSGQLHQPRLSGDEVRLEYSDRLTRLHPIKLLEVLRTMPVEADKHDDWMADQFGVVALEREPIEALTDAEFSHCQAIWQQHWMEIDELLKESQRKRSMFLLDEISAYAFYQLRARLPLAGAVLSRLSESAATFNDPECDPAKREAALAKCAKEMKALSPEVLRENLGHAFYSISPFADGKPEVLEYYFEDSDYLKVIERARSSGQHMMAALAMFSSYSYLLGRVAFDEPIEEALWAGLAAASDKPFREAATILLHHGRAIVDRMHADAAEDDLGDDPGDDPADDSETEDRASAPTTQGEA